MKYITECNKCFHIENQTEFIELTHENEIDFIITCNNCGSDSNILLNK